MPEAATAPTFVDADYTALLREVVEDAWTDEYWSERLGEPVRSVLVFSRTVNDEVRFALCGVWARHRPEDERIYVWCQLEHRPTADVDGDRRFLRIQADFAADDLVASYRKNVLATSNDDPARED